MNGIKNSFAVVLGLIAIGIVLGVVITTNFNLDSKSVAGPNSGKIYTEEETTPQQENPKLNVGNFNPNTMFVDIVKEVRPSIVSIYTTKNVKIENNPFYYFFRQMPQDENHMPEQTQSGLGSGIIISKDGYILTNYHVVNDVDELKVKLVDNREFEAKVIGSDASTEIALVKIEADDLPLAVLGNSDKVEIGEWVFAIGSPLSLTSTVTAGIVSALSRNINIIRDGNNSGIEDFIQTDAAINPGNSGGALVNLQGQVIGVNTAIATQTNYYMGYGFAVPINIAKSVVEDLMKFGEVRRGYLGVYIDEVTPVTAKGVKLDKPQGVLVTSVIEGSAAQEAGIKEGDVILKVNGQEVNQPNELQARVGVFNPGDEVKLDVWRYGKKMTITAKLQTRDGETIAEKPREEKKEEKSIKNVGLKLANLNSDQLNELELEVGVGVVSVSSHSPASRARISRGDVIFELDGKQVNSVDDFNDAINDHSAGDVVRMKIRRSQNGDLFDRLVFMEIPE
jgi:serine protease Do